MDKEYKRNPPTIRMDSPETVFDNDISGSEPEDNGINYSSVPANPVRDKLYDGHASDLVNDQIQTKRLEMEYALLEEEDYATSSLRRLRIAKENVPTGSFVDQTKSNRDFSKVEKINGDIVLKTKLNKNNKDNLTHGWTLNEDDLFCVPVVLNKTRVQEYMTRKVDGCEPGRRNKMHRKGSELQMMASFKMTINQLRDVIGNKGLVPHDVFPDGNCLFAAVVDQLRIRGDFSFTTHTLRQSAVKYLKENPFTDDGTPIEMFLTDEVPWETYLSLMSEDGAWGDHIILGALTNVINKQILIYSGTTGERETIMCPKTLKHKIGLSETDNQALDEDNVVYVGHVKESHYVSLRPKRWKQSLRKGLTKRRLSSKAAHADDSLVKCPVRHIDLILRQTFRMGLVESICSDDVNTLIPNRIETNDDITEIFGSLICKLVPRNIKSECFESDMSMVFPSGQETEKNVSSFQKAVHTILQTPKDTNIVSTTASSKSMDLIAENSEAVVGQLMLIPKNRKLWRGQTTALKDETTYLKAFEVNFNWSSDLFKSKMSNNSFDMHFMLGFHCVWPDVADQWPRRHRESGFPEEHTVKSIVESGCHVIPMTLDTRMSDILDDPIYFMAFADDHTWCYSFAAAEKEISRVLSTEQRQCFLIFKSLIDTVLKDIPLPVSVVKSIFFYACENIEKSSWKSKPGECILILLKKTVECFKNQHVPHYFMCEKNLLKLIPEETTDECYERLDCVRLQPMVTLYFMLDQLDVMSSEIGSLVEEIIENTNENTCTFTGVHTSSQPLLTVSRKLLRDLILHEDYKTAILVFQDILEENEISLERNGSDLMKSVLWGLDIGYPWCFALYVDIKQKTNLALQVCEGYGTIHVTELFGPGCIGDLPNTLVPECFSISRGNLTFASMITGVLLQAVSGKMFIKCVKYYLMRYSKLAGEALILPDWVPVNDARVSNSMTGTQIDMAAVSSVAMSTSRLFQLHSLYVCLFNFCKRAYRVEEFREMMPAFTEIANRIGTPMTIQNIRIMWNSLDANKKVGTWWR
ncbi:uncharacterized protein LOC123561458 [Mercenaria mercenaria]|uniref:uncharacterized protein LOC123561458 n=1 Tax=Mercenaria mercenaria TaxID=6596 RepID=UPI00234ECCF8|nr:uncharacterized protein LOC123561458 [Mercenaria mercenaria]